MCQSTASKETLKNSLIESKPESKEKLCKDAIGRHLFTNIIYFWSISNLSHHSQFSLFEKLLVVLRIFKKKKKNTLAFEPKSHSDSHSDLFRSESFQCLLLRKGLGSFLSKVWPLWDSVTGLGKFIYTLN